MTQNQINYWKYKEDQRANKIKEAETERHNRATESAEWGKINESKRHNVASENNELFSNVTQRSHYARQDQISLNQLSETQRHNMTAENNELARITEIARSNVANEDLRSKELTENYVYHLGILGSNLLKSLGGTNVYSNPTTNVYPNTNIYTDGGANYNADTIRQYAGGNSKTPISAHNGSGKDLIAEPKSNLVTNGSQADGAAPLITASGKIGKVQAEVEVGKDLSIQGSFNLGGAK